MTKEVTLPFTSETCKKIKKVLLHVLLISGIPTLGIGFWFWIIDYTGYGWVYPILGLGLTIYGMIFTIMFFLFHEKTIRNLIEENKITFKCKCDEQQNERGDKQ